MQEINITVIIVFRNEARHIVSCIDSVLAQFKDESGWELILVNGASDDNSVNLIHERLKTTNVRYMILENPGKTLAKGWNLGIINAKGKFIIRPDAHATLGKDYISKSVEILHREPEVGVVGGVLETKAITFTGRMIKSALSMRSGVGNSSFRTGAESGYKDTAVYGLYRKEVFDKAGLFNENLVRHQDTEFHRRVLKNGYKIYMNNEIKAVYFCRDSLSAIGKQMFEIGYYFSYLVEENATGSLRLRHMIPVLFYSGLFFFIILGYWYKMFLWLAVFIFGLYILSVSIDAILKMIKVRSFLPVATIFIIPFIHINYAAGTLSGLISLLVRKKS